MLGVRLVTPFSHAASPADARVDRPEQYRQRDQRVRRVLLLRGHADADCDEAEEKAKRHPPGDETSQRERSCP